MAHGRYVSGQSNIHLERHALQGHLVGVVGELQCRTYRIEGEASDSRVPEVVMDIWGEVKVLESILRAGW